MDLKLLSFSHHRNGVCGAPFYTGLFQDEDESIKMFVDFGGERFAVLQVDLLSKGDVAFGSNSWRGDRYSDKIRSLCKAADPSVSDGALYVEYEIPNL